MNRTVLHVVYHLSALLKSCYTFKVFRRVLFLIHGLVDRSLYTSLCLCLLSYYTMYLLNNTPSGGGYVMSGRNHENNLENMQLTKLVPAAKCPSFFCLEFSEEH